MAPDLVVPPYPPTAFKRAIICDYRDGSSFQVFILDPDRLNNGRRVKVANKSRKGNWSRPTVYRDRLTNFRWTTVWMGTGLWDELPQLDQDDLDMLRTPEVGFNKPARPELSSPKSPKSPKPPPLPIGQSPRVSPHLRQLWRKNPHCFWCGRKTDLPEKPRMVQLRDATREHLISRWSPVRLQIKGLIVVACAECNYRRGFQDSKAQCGRSPFSPPFLRPGRMYRKAVTR